MPHEGKNLFRRHCKWPNGCLIKEATICGTIILSSALEGLDYLAEELRYEREHDNEIPNLRWRCAQLASSMSKAGLECRPEVIRWLELASNDPFPEVRYAMSDNLIGLSVGDAPE